MAQQWKERTRPASLEKRYEFPDYETLREFLERAAELSESINYYPDIGFGRDYVNVTIRPEEEEKMLSEKQHGFARQLDELDSQVRG